VPESFLIVVSPLYEDLCNIQGVKSYLKKLVLTLPSHSQVISI